MIEVIFIGADINGQTYASHSHESDETKKLRERLEKQIVAAEWLKTIAQIIEVVSLEQLYSLNGELVIDGKKDIINGVLTSTIGQFLAAIGVTKEFFTTDKNSIINIHKKLLLTDYIQLLGTIVEIKGTSEVIDNEIKNIFEEVFIS